MAHPQVMTSGCPNCNAVTKMLHCCLMNELPQTKADLERLIATIKAIMAADPAKARDCMPLLAKLNAQRRPAA